MDSREARLIRVRLIAAPSQVSVYAPLPQLGRPRMMMRMKWAAAERSSRTLSGPHRILNTQRRFASVCCAPQLGAPLVRHGSLRTAAPADAAAAARLSFLARHLAVSAHADAGRLDGFVTALRATVRRDGRRPDAAAFFASAHARPVRQHDAISSCAPPRLPALRCPSAVSAAGTPQQTNKRQARMKCSGPNCTRLRSSSLPTHPPPLSCSRLESFALARHLARHVVCRLGLVRSAELVSQRNSL